MTSRSGSYRVRMTSRSFRLSLIFEGFLECEKLLEQGQSRALNLKALGSCGVFLEESFQGKLALGREGRGHLQDDSLFMLSNRIEDEHRQGAAARDLDSLFRKKIESMLKERLRSGLRTNQRLQVVKKPPPRLFVERAIAEVLKDKALMTSGSAIVVGGGIHQDCLNVESTGSVLQVSSMVAAQEKTVCRSKIAKLHEKADLCCGSA